MINKINRNDIKYATRTTRQGPGLDATCRPGPAAPPLLAARLGTALKEHRTAGGGSCSPLSLPLRRPCRAAATSPAAAVMRVLVPLPSLLGYDFISTAIYYIWMKSSPVHERQVTRRPAAQQSTQEISARIQRRSSARRRRFVASIIITLHSLLTVEEEQRGMRKYI